MSRITSISTKGDLITPQIHAAISDEQKALAFFECYMQKPGAACAHCASADVYQMKDATGRERQADNRWRCRQCKKQYTIRTGTVLSASRIPLRHWCFGFWRVVTCKNGVSALEIHRQTGISYKSSLLMLTRIRMAMADSAPPMLGARGQVVEVDETYIGGKTRFRNYRPQDGEVTHRHAKRVPKIPVLAMIERDGAVKTRVLTRATAEEIIAVMKGNIDKRARIATDMSRIYLDTKNHFTGGHRSINHSKKEYARGDVHTNTVESFFAQLKRGLHATFHSVHRAQLPLYLAEFEFRHNYRNLDDGSLVVQAIRGAARNVTMHQAIEEAQS